MSSLIRSTTFCATLLAVSCSPMGSSGENSRTQLHAWSEKAGVGLVESSAPQQSVIPLVDFGNLPSKFGKPSWKTGPNGNYELTYPNEAGLAGGVIDGFSLIGSPEAIAPLTQAPAMLLPLPDGKSKEIAVDWRSVEVPGLNREIRFYQTGHAMGDMNDTWESEPFSRTDAAGRTGFYQASVETLEESEVKALLSRLRSRD